MNIIKAKKVGFEDKSQAEIEAELLAKAETAAATETTQEPEKEVEVQEVEQPKPIELKDEDVLSFLGKKLNKTIGSFEDLTPQPEQLPEDVQTFLKYKKETGRGISDFMKLNRDYDSLPEDDRIREYLSIKEEGLDREDIAAMMKDFEIDEDLDDEKTIRDKKIAKKKTLTEAKKFFAAQKEQYKIPLEDRGLSVSESDKKEFEEYKKYIADATTIQEETRRKGQWFDQKTNELFSDGFKGFEFAIKDNEDKVVKTLKFAPGDAAELKAAQSSPQNFIKKFLDENGLMKDAAGYHRGLAMAMHPEKFAKFFYEQGLADAKEGFVGGIKNVNMGQIKTPQSVPSGVKVQVLNGDSNGNRLKIVSAKKLP